MAKKLRRIRWVRFGKRTHRRVILGVVLGRKWVRLAENRVYLRTKDSDAAFTGCGRIGLAEALLVVRRLLVSWEMVAANNSGVSSDSDRQAQHDGTEGDTDGSRDSNVTLTFTRRADNFNRRDAFSTWSGIRNLTLH
jgi:hypothetical protein